MPVLIFPIPFIDSVLCPLKLYYIKLLTKKQKDMQMKISKDNVLSPEIHTSFIHTSFIHISVWKRKNVSYNTSLKWINWQSELPFDTVLINLV